MRFGFDEISYKKTYFKYTWISIIIALALFGIQKLFVNLFEDTKILFYIFYPFLSVSVVYLGLCMCTGLPFVIYISIKKIFQTGYIIIENDCLRFVRVCNIFDNINDIYYMKIKKTKFFNIDRIIEKKWYYKIKCEVDYYFEKASNKNYVPIIKHKKGIFKIPKCFGEEKIFRENLYKLIGSKRIETESVKNEKYKSFTKQGVIDFLLSILGSIMVIFGNALFLIIGFAITSYGIIKGVNVLREENRDRFLSFVNIIIGTIFWIYMLLIIISLNT